MAFANSFYKSAMESSVAPAGSDDEESFVVLEDPEDSLSISPSLELTPPLRLNKVREMQNLIKTEIALESEPAVEVPKAQSLAAFASNLSKINISPDASYEEIQRHVEELIKENETLKNTIVQNNMSMKTHYDRFLAYKEEVDNVMKKNKEKFNEAKVIIDKLKEENAKLTGEVDVYINLKKLHEEEIINLKDKVRKQESSCSVDVKSSEDSNDKLAHLQIELDAADVQIADLKSENRKLQSENENSNKRIEELQKTVDTLQGRNKSLAETQDELAVKEKKIPRLEEQLQTKQEEINVLQFEITALKDRVSKLDQENNHLKTQVSEEAQVDYERKLKLKDEEIKKLLKYKSIKEKYFALEEDLTQSRQQLSLAQQTITALEAEQEKRIEEIEKLRRMLQENVNDEIFALKEQLDVYKSDYEAEKESKTTLKREKDQIAEDLKNVQTRNKQLQNEIETLRARIQPKSDGYICPKCSFGFNSYQSLENHVHRCLELDDVH